MIFRLLRHTSDLLEAEDMSSRLIEGAWYQTRSAVIYVARRPCLSLRKQTLHGNAERKRLSHVERKIWLSKQMMMHMREVLLRLRHGFLSFCWEHGEAWRELCVAISKDSGSDIACLLMTTLPPAAKCTIRTRRRNGSSLLVAYELLFFSFLLQLQTFCCLFLVCFVFVRESQSAWSQSVCFNFPFSGGSTPATSPKERRKST